MHRRRTRKRRGSFVHRNTHQQPGLQKEIHQLAIGNADWLSSHFQRAGNKEKQTKEVKSLTTPDSPHLTANTTLSSTFQSSRLSHTIHSGKRVTSSPHLILAHSRNPGYHTGWVKKCSARCSTYEWFLRGTTTVNEEMDPDINRHVISTNSSSCHFSSFSSLTLHHDLYTSRLI